MEEAFYNFDAGLFVAQEVGCDVHLTLYVAKSHKGRCRLCDVLLLSKLIATHPNVLETLAMSLQARPPTAFSAGVPVSIISRT